MVGRGTTSAGSDPTLSPIYHVIGEGLYTREDQRRATEVDVAIHVLNRMLELGRPISVRIA